MTTALDQLEALADQAGRERAAAEAHEGELRRLLAEGRAAAEAAERRDADLADVLERARAAEEAARERLGACRAQSAAADREHETVADQAAGGDAAAVKKLRAARDHAEELAALVRAHERRTAQLEAEREAAEQALTEHQARRLDINARAIEELLLQAATGVDRRLIAVAELAGIALELSATRPPRPPGSYKVGSTSHPLSFLSVERAFYQHTGPINPAGSGFHISRVPLATAAKGVARSWRLNLVGAEE